MHLERVHRRESPMRTRNWSARLARRRLLRRITPVWTSAILHVLIGSISALSIWVRLRSWLSSSWHTWPIPTNSRTHRRAADIRVWPTAAFKRLCLQVKKIWYENILSDWMHTRALIMEVERVWTPWKYVLTPLKSFIHFIYTDFRT